MIDVERRGKLGRGDGCFGVVDGELATVAALGERAGRADVQPLGKRVPLRLRMQVDGVEHRVSG